MNLEIKLMCLGKWQRVNSVPSYEVSLKILPQLEIVTTIIITSIISSYIGGPQLLGSNV